MDERLREALARRRAEAEKLRADVPRLRAMAQGAAAVSRVVPPALRAKFATPSLPDDLRLRAEGLVDELEAAANDAAEGVVLRLLSRADQAEARAACLAELCAEFGALSEVLPIALPSVDEIEAAKPAHGSADPSQAKSLGNTSESNLLLLLFNNTKCPACGAKLLEGGACPMAAVDAGLPPERRVHAARYEDGEARPLGH